MQRITLVVIHVSYLLFFSLPLKAEIPTRNFNPFAVLVGLPELKSGYIKTSGDYSLGINMTASNQWNVEGNGNEVIFMDGEININELYWAYGLNSVEFSVSIPWLMFTNGRLDPLIEDFHELFSMENAGREYFYQNELLFIYQNQSSGNQLRLDASESGLGDVRLGLGWQLKRSADFASSLRVQLTLANADEKKWLGSGSYDLSISSSNEWLWLNWKIQAQFSALIMQNQGFLEGQKEDAALILGAAASYRLVGDVWWTLQYDGHTRLYKHSSISPLSDGQMVSMAFSIEKPTWRFHVAILEDVAVQSAPDVGFQLGLRVDM